MNYIIKEYFEVTCRDPFDCFKCGKEVKKGNTYLKYEEGGYPYANYKKLCKSIEKKKAIKQLIRAT